MAQVKSPISEVATSSNYAPPLSIPKKNQKDRTVFPGGSKLFVIFHISSLLVPGGQLSVFLWGLLYTNPEPHILRAMFPYLNVHPSSLLVYNPEIHQRQSIYDLVRTIIWGLLPTTWDAYPSHPRSRRRRTRSCLRHPRRHRRKPSKGSRRQRGLPSQGATEIPGKTADLGAPNMRHQGR